MKSHALILLVGLFLNGALNAQTEEKTINGKTYVYNHKNFVVQRADINNIIQNRNTYRENVSIEKQIPFEDIFRQILSKDRVDQISGAMLIKVFSDENGSVLGIGFVFPSKQFQLTLEEMYNIDSLLRNKKYTFTSSISENNVLIVIWQRIIFNNLY